MSNLTAGRRGQALAEYVVVTALCCLMCLAAAKLSQRLISKLYGNMLTVFTIPIP